MLFIPPGTAHLQRLTGAYLDDGEISKITSFLKEQGKPVYRNEILEDESDEAGEEDQGEEKDVLFDEAVEIARKTGLISASSLQRQFKIGYNRAARMVEVMEARGIVGPQDGARPREVLIR
jgi:S-DNA-T family DNA segregation ATPase FtsK/SpoIIIE